MPPLMDMTIEPKSRSDAGKLLDALGELVIYDPMLSFRIDAETGQTIIHGMSEAHLDDHIETLRCTFAIDVSAGSKQMAYRETLVGTTELTYEYKKQSGGPSCWVKSSLTILVDLSKVYYASATCSRPCPPWRPFPRASPAPRST